MPPELDTSLDPRELRRELARRDLLEGSTLAMDPETGDFRPVTPSGERQMIVSGRNLDAGSGPVFRAIEGPPDLPRMESGQRQMVIGERRQARPDDLGYSEPELARVRDLARQAQTEGAQGALRGAAKLEPEKVRLAVDRSMLRSSTGGYGFDPTIAPDPGSGRSVMPLSQKFIADAEQARDILRDPNIKAKLAPRQLSQIQEFAFKAGPLMHAAGNVLLAAELGYNIGQQGSVLGGAMETSADAVEGIGALAQLPQSAMQQIPGYGDVGVNIGAEGLAALGRFATRSMEPYRRMQQAESRSDFIDRNTRANMEMNPALTPSEARDSAIQLLRRVEAAPEGGYEGSPLGTGELPFPLSEGQRATERLIDSQRRNRELQKEEYMNFLVQEGYLKRDDQGRLIQAARTRQEGGYPTMSEFEDDRMLAGGIR